MTAQNHQLCHHKPKKNHRIGHHGFDKKHGLGGHGKTHGLRPQVLRGKINESGHDYQDNGG